MDNKPLSRLQQLLLKELRPSLLNQWDSQTSKDIHEAANLVMIPPLPVSPKGPVYTFIYSGFLLDGIITVAIEPASPLTFFYQLELLDGEYCGEIKVRASDITEPPEELITRLLEEITNAYQSAIQAELSETRTKLN